MRTLLFLLVAWAWSPLCPARELNALFIGNSFTFGGNESAVQDHGGVPQLVAEIAARREQPIGAVMLASPGKDWAWHLRQPETAARLAEREWDFVVIQDFSTRPTRAGNRARFLRDGERFLRLIHQHSPGATVVLFETWARSRGHGFYEGARPDFGSPAEMSAELREGYDALAERLEALAPRRVRVAPVGSAFEAAIAAGAEESLFGTDLYHAGTAGSYLAALVLHHVLTGDSPGGAVREFATFEVPEAQALTLQAVALAVGTARLAESALAD